MPEVSQLEPVFSLIEKFGVMAVLLVYFVVRDFLRYRADQQEKKEYRESIKKLNDEKQADRDGIIKDQSEIITKARTTHRVLVDTLKDYKPTAEAFHALETANDTGEHRRL